jgi:hypothetical protein
MVSFMPRPLFYWGKSLPNPLDRRLGGLQTRSGHCGGEKYLCCVWKPGRLAHSPSLYSYLFNIIHNEEVFQIKYLDHIYFMSFLWYADYNIIEHIYKLGNRNLMYAPASNSIIIVIVDVQLVLRKRWDMILGSCRNEKSDICPLDFWEK